MRRSKPRRSKTQTNSTYRNTLPFLEHLYELRRRISYVGLSIVLWAAVAYGIQQHIVDVILKPAGEQNFIYTSPGGGLDFLIRVTLYVGILLSFPVIIYNFIRFLQPIIRDATRFALICSIASAGLALVGVFFGYFFVLPAALSFLLNQFTTDQIKPLLTIQAYMSFVVKLVFGTAVLFQLPLLLYLINHIKALSARKLVSFKIEKWVIVISFVLAAVVNPSPRMYDTLLLAVPMLFFYHLGVAIVWYVNRYSTHRPMVKDLSIKDALLQAERDKRREASRPLFQQEIM